jgi:alkylation response protein AidB-like acyl-CoA dehydrogenase
MRLELSTEDADFRRRLRDFFTTRVDQDIRDAVAQRLPLTKEMVVRSHRTLNAAGLAVPHWPREWGGLDWTGLQRHIWHEEMQRACVPPPFSVNASMVGPVLAAFGSEEQKQRFLPPTANLDIWWAQGFSEPEAGSDLAALRTTAVRVGAEWIVNGQKTWTTLAQHADWIFCLVRTDPAVKKQAGISFFLIDMTSPGVTVRPIELIDGSLEVNEVWLEDVHVPAANLVGEENRGWDYAKFLLGNERVGVASIGSSKRILAQAKMFARSVATGDGASMLDDPFTAGRIAELENDLFALELTALRVVAHSSDGQLHPASSVLKLKGTELQQAISELVVDLAGPAALTSASAAAGSDLPAWTHRAAPLYLNLRKASIYGGSNEVQRQIITKSILGL